MRRYLYLVLLALVSGAVFAQVSGDTPTAGAQAQQAPEQVGIPPPPPMAGDDDGPDLPPPTVTIRREEGKLVEEYRVGGVVYMVRVTPEHGVPYFLVDMDGDGILEKTDLEFGPNMQIPMWVIYEWK